MKYKIQTRSVNGWADLKIGDDNGNYAVELFNTISDALAELYDLSTLHGLDHYRVVAETMPSDDDLY